MVARRFAVEECLGVGGFAVVYRAFDRELKRSIALKVLKSSSRDPRLVALRREVAVARDVACPHLARVFDFDFDTDAELSFLTMELAEGGSLKAELRRGPLSIERSVALTAEILTGLEALHAHGIVHRDVKPGNVLLDASGHAKLADFGLALSLEPDGLTRLTSEAAFVGTVEYLAPEQFRGSPIDGRSDLYSLGVTLFEMLAGRSPQPAGTRLETVVGHLQRAAPDVRALRPEVPAWLAAFVARLLEKEPSQRYPSAGEALTSLRSHRTGIARALWRRHRRAASVASGVVLLLAGLATWYLATRPRFSHLVEGEGGAVVAVDEKGHELWRLADIGPGVAERATLARIEPGARKTVALFPLSLADLPSRAARTLTFLDPETGKVIREMEVPTTEIPFHDVSPRFVPGRLRAEDVDGDGIDEIFASFNHMLKAPSFVMMFEPAASRWSIVFQALGHYCPAGVHRIDGAPVLLLLGINNGMGWINAMAAVKLPIVHGIEGVRAHPGRAFSPELPRDNGVVPSDLLWYSLLPPGRVACDLGVEGKVIELDDATRTLSVSYEDGRRERLRYDGSSVSLPIDHDGFRRKAREAAYTALREAERSRGVGATSQAVAEMSVALESARQAGDVRLAEVAERWLGRAFISAGREKEAEERLEPLFLRAESPSNVAWDAAKAFHLAGDLRRAAAWYEKGLMFDGGPTGGRQKHYYLFALVTALAEAGNWEAARRSIASFLDSSGAPAMGRLAEQYVNWRSGAPVDVEGLDPMLPNSTDPIKSWYLEIRHAAGAPPADLIAELDPILARADEAKGQLHSLRGQLLGELGRAEEAKTAFARALAAFTLAAGTDVAARFDRHLAEDRLRALSARLREQERVASGR
ncbi:MAG: serine/threonine protein kinase [Holophagales bacterium]|nr:MAG: serine/threonine protein kinase [Holophagales bacterium]